MYTGRHLSPHTCMPCSQANAHNCGLLIQAVGRCRDVLQEMVRHPQGKARLKSGALGKELKHLVKVSDTEWTVYTSNPTWRWL